MSINKQNDADAVAEVLDFIRGRLRGHQFKVEDDWYLLAEHVEAVLVAVEIE